MNVLRLRCRSAGSVIGPIAIRMVGVSQLLTGIHVRYGNVGGISQQNTHPFVQKLRGMDLVLAHNGTLKSDQPKSHVDGRYKPDGTTDSPSLAERPHFRA